jgi:hypothetical protein
LFLAWPQGLQILRDSKDENHLVDRQNFQERRKRFQEQKIVGKKRLESNHDIRMRIKAGQTPVDVHQTAGRSIKFVDL